MNLLLAWQNFYVIVGSAGGALVGIQFVVIALIASTRKHADPASIGTFGTPTVVHFGAALTVSAIMTAPWPSLLGLTISLAACGLGGLLYTAVAVRRARRQRDYKPVAEDWFWYAILPSGVYVALESAALLLRTAAGPAMFVIGGAALGLLLIGVRNSWDTVTHIVANGPRRDVAKSEGRRHLSWARSS